MAARIVPFTHEEVKKVIRSYVADGYSCSETTIRVLMKLFGYEPENEMLRMTSTFRGGAGIDGKCGVVESALAFLSFVSTRDGYRCSQTDLVKYAEEIHRDMNEKFGGYQCSYLWDLFISQNKDININKNVDCIIEDGIVMIADSICSITERMKNEN